MASISRGHRFHRILLAALAGILIACAAHAEEIVRVGGAGSGLGGMRLLAKAFEESHPGTKIQIFVGSAKGRALLAKVGYLVPADAKGR